MKLPNAKRNCNIMLLRAFLLVLIANFAFADRSATPARVLAKQTGATQFKEEKYETHADCNEHKHHLRKRSSDEDVDYEVYQGVVGRPGIDFPIYPRIPRTSFSCKSYGNGYFADMDTDCQVFHICEEGRKISFLCPNGTIFQQSELTCDWWFKVNCLGSPGYYADSAEILNKQRLHRVRPSVPVQGFNIVGSGLNYKPRLASHDKSSGKRNNNAKKSDRRIDSDEEPSLENVDFEDLSGEKHPKSKTISNIDDNSNDNESQVAAESGSFVNGKRRNDYKYEKPNNAFGRKPTNDGKNNGRNGSGSYKRTNGGDRGNNEGYRGKNGADRGNNGGDRGSNGGDRGNNGGDRSYNGGDGGSNGNDRGNNGNRGAGDRGSQRHGYANLQNSDNYNVGAEKARNNNNRGQRNKLERKPTAESFETTESNKSPELQTSLKPEQIIELVDVVGKSNGAVDISAEPDEKKPEIYEDRVKKPIRISDKLPNVTPTYPSGTYSTARRLNSTRTTPFYTPTVPPINKAKTTEGKGFYIKGYNPNYIATTPNPNRVNTGSGIGIFFESSSATKPASNSVESDGDFITSTYRPIIIGMRHNYDLTSPETRIPIQSNSNFNGEFILQKKPAKATNLADYLPTTTTPATTGPTYLPKSSSSPKGVQDAAGGDFLLFAPGPLPDDDVSRNVDEMLKTMNIVKDKLEDGAAGESSQYAAGQGRDGLEIPPSSGPDVLVSLAKYFAGEQNGSKGNSLNTFNDDGKARKSGKPGDGSVSASPAAGAPGAASGMPQLSTIPATKPSDTTASITTEANSNVNVKEGDDIKSSLLSQRTVDKYTSLFGLNEPKTGGKQQNNLNGDDILNKLAKDLNSSGVKGRNSDEGKSRNLNDNASALFPQIGTTDATLNQLAGVPESRKIAQVFSNALNTYLENPKSFRAQLASVRPTEPPIDGKPNFTPITVTDSSLFNGGTAASYLPTIPTRSADISTTTPTIPTSTQSSIASEINSKFDYSTQLTSTTDILDSTTYRPGYGSNEKHSSFEFSGELAPPAGAGESGEDDLQREQTQSFVKSKNDLTPGNSEKSVNNGEEKIQLPTFKPTENPWSHISQTVYLDPLTINDGLMKDTTTPNSFTFTPKEPTNRPRTTTHGKLQVRTSTISHRTETPNSDGANTWDDIFSNYNIPRDTLPSNNGLQRIANKLFGGLNETEALHLKNVMQQAEHDRQVLGLLLLLIQTCDDQNGQALERSRKHLLNALIDMDGKLQSGKNSNHKTTTSRVPVTTYRRGSEEVTTRPTRPSASAHNPTTTDLPSTSTVSSALFSGSSVEETTKFEIHVEDPETDVASSSSTAMANSSSDKRALELLKSLYSLASKFTSRR